MGPNELHHSAACFQLKDSSKIIGNKDLATNETKSKPESIWISGSPIHSPDQAQLITLVAVVIRPHRNIGLVTLVDKTDLDLNIWDREIIRDDKDPWAKIKF